MKNHLCIGVFLAMFVAKAQETDTVKPVQQLEENVVKILSIEARADVGLQIGIVLETPKKKRPTVSDYFKTDSVLKFFYSEGYLESSSWINDITGKGFASEFGNKTYFNKHEYKGFYSAGYILGGNLEFDGTVRYVDKSKDNRRFVGRYRYFSLFAPEIGYKLLLFDNNLDLDFHLGVAWMIEIKGKGDVDNKSFDNWVPRLGVALGYRF